LAAQIAQPVNGEQPSSSDFSWTLDAGWSKNNYALLRFGLPSESWFRECIWQKWSDAIERLTLAGRQTINTLSGAHRVSLWICGTERVSIVGDGQPSARKGENSMSK
jgi:hypothetical protein